jgi:hypothetical protein
MTGIGIGIGGVASMTVILETKIVVVVVILPSVETAAYYWYECCWGHSFG